MRQLVWVTLLALTSGCGYEHGFGARDRLGIRSVSVSTVENLTFRQGIDRLLTRQLARDLAQFTGLVPGAPDAADARLEVTLRDVQGRSITEQSGGESTEAAVLLDADVRLIDRRTGRVLYAQRHHDWAEYRSAVGETRSQAIVESVADLSRRILTAIDDGGLSK